MVSCARPTSIILRYRRAGRWALLLAALVLFFAPCTAKASCSESHRYLEQSGEKSHYFDWILDKTDGYHLKAVSTTEEHRTFMDEAMVTRRWSLTNPAEDTTVQARRDGNRIVLKGRFHGRQVDKELSIDEAPWFQSLSTSLRSFLATPGESIEFWTLRPDKLTAHKVRATKKGLETLTLGERQIEAYKVEVCLTGLGALLGRGRYWFRASDRLLLHYRGPGGLPGIPVTTITLAPPPSP